MPLSWISLPLLDFFVKKFVCFLCVVCVFVFFLLFLVVLFFPLDLFCWLFLWGVFFSLLVSFEFVLLEGLWFV